MISTRDIKRKIKTIQNIGQMCRAMKTVSLVKLQKAETRLAAMRPYADRLTRAMAMLSGALPEPPGGKREKAVAVITSDKGLCGGYNSSILRRAQPETEKAAVITLGRKGDRFLRRRGARITDSLVPLGSEPNFAQIVPLADKLAKRVQEGDIAELKAVHGRFLHGTRSEVVTNTIFPLEGATEDIIFEPEPEKMAPLALNRYFRTALYAAALEGAASEHGARVAAMTAASDNAEKMIHELTMAYNKARQSSITKELTEIVGSAEALA